MGKTKGSKNITVRNKLTNSPHAPEVQYDRLDPIDRLITYYYYIFILSDGQKGWDPEKSGFKEHWAQYEVLQTVYTHTQFYTRGKKFGELAQDLIYINYHLDEPQFGDIPPLSSRPVGTYPSPAKRRKSAPTTPAPTTPAPPTPTMPINAGSTKRTASIMKPHPEMQETSMTQLVKQTNDLGLMETQVSVGTISIPILRGTWEKKMRKMEGFLKTAYMKEFSLIRVLPHSGISLKRVELQWLNPTTLQIGVLWPRFMSDIMRQVALQTTTSTHKFNEDHDVIDSMYADIGTKVNKADEKKKRVVDYGIFYFDKPQDTSKGGTEILILNVTLTKDDIDDEEDYSPGDKVKVLQIICQEQTNEEGEKLLNVTELDAKLGKSDPDGKKAGDSDPVDTKRQQEERQKEEQEARQQDESTNAFDYTRFVGLYKYHNSLPPPEELIARFSGAEENLFYLVSFLLENNRSFLDEDFITQVMTQFDGRPVEMMRYVEEQVAPASTSPSVPNAIAIIPDDQSTSSMCSVRFEDIKKADDDDDDDIEDHAHNEERAAYDKQKEHAQKRVDADVEKEISEKQTTKSKKKSRITRSSMQTD